MALMKASTRTERGSRQVRRLREKGLVPAIVYGHGEPPVSVTLSTHDLELALHHGERLLEVDIDGAKQNVLVKEVQWDTFGQAILHADLCRVSLDELVQVTVPVVLRGTPVGLADGGVIQQSLSDLEIECAVARIPEEIRIMVTALKVGDSIHLRDIQLPEGARALEEPDALICSCNIVAEEALAEEGEEVAEPELIGGEEEDEEKGEAGE